MAADDYSRPKKPKGDKDLYFPFNVKKTQPPPPPASIYAPTPSGEVRND